MTIMEERLKQCNEEEQIKRDIAQAMIHRVLTPEEAKIALDCGHWLLLTTTWRMNSDGNGFSGGCMSYDELGAKKEYLELWYQQARLRALEDQKK